MKRTFATAASLWFALLSLSALAHGGPRPLIVDTDLATDDVRALAFLLACPSVRVEAVVTSGEGRTPETSALRLLQILKHLNRPDLPVGTGTPADAPAPPWRAVVDSLAWSSLAPVREESFEPAAAVLRRTLSASGHGMVYLCLGPATNLAALLRDEPRLTHRIEEVWFYGSAPESGEACWNRDADPESARTLFGSGLPVLSVRLGEADTFPLDEEVFSRLGCSQAPAARLLSALFDSPEAREKIREKHFLAWDEAVALCASSPGLATFEPVKGTPVQVLARWNRQAGRALLLDVLEGGGGRPLPETPPVVLAAFPSAPDQFRADVRDSVSRIVSRHGGEEWRAALLTNELHGHLGTFSLVGVKMGIRARERLGAALDEVEVLSFAGSEPPLSCLNDGLQASTGATVGRGTIRVEGAGGPRAEAEFVRGPERLRLRLKDSVRRRIEEDIRAAVEQCGNLTPEYFREIRRLSIRHWEEMDRAEIFEEVPAK
jgi:pyrimidine-specific ribonucleoside hydrolase